jgi:hypothetical protein
VLGGALDPANPLSALRANPLVWTRVFAPIELDWCIKTHVRFTPDAFMCGPPSNAYTFHPSSQARGAPIPKVKFPPSQGLRINMMPFKLFRARETLPASCHPYLSLIESLPVPFMGTIGSITRIAYLTIDESDVAAGASHRRPGLHIEREGADGQWDAMLKATLAASQGPCNDRKRVRAAAILAVSGCVARQEWRRWPSRSKIAPRTATSWAAAGRRGRSRGRGGRGPSNHVSSARHR